ncbi:hypothetical protein SB724_19205 [Bacillus sp. SIMBA_031]|uniref:hypothetical protein n=1 Tax=Bacillus sp. SIMBA_031 TaxID=3085774 RepID=UPI00397A796D
MKKIAVVVFILSAFFLNALPAFAEEQSTDFSGGILDGVHVMVEFDFATSYSYTTKLTDNKVGTFEQFYPSTTNKQIRIVSGIVDSQLEYFRIHTTSNAPSLQLSIPDADTGKKTTYTVPSEYFKGKPFKLENAPDYAGTNVTISPFTNRDRVQEINFYGKAFQNISNVHYELKGTSIKFNYNLPDRFNFLMIYANGEQIESRYKDSTFRIDDLKPNTEYTFKMVSYSKHLQQSKPYTVTIKTKSEQPPEIENAVVSKENDGYVVSWEEPTNGQIIIYLDGQKYKTVPSADKEATISAQNLPFDVYGNPKIKLVPVSTKGTEGSPVFPKGSAGDPSSNPLGKVKLPFSGQDLLSTSFSIVGVIASIIVFCLVLAFAPKIIKVIKDAASQRRKEGQK